MNLLHLKYALEVAKAGSLSKASETLLIATPNISRSIKELETDLGITVFERTAKGMELTAEGEELMEYAKSILGQIEQVEAYYKNGTPKKQKFSVSVPRASYISDAFAEFSKSLTGDSCEVLYQETNSLGTIKNVLEHNYSLGIIRYAQSYDKYFRSMLEEKNLVYELVSEFTFSVIMSNESPLASKELLRYEDLNDYIEIAHADPYVPSVPPSSVAKEELSEAVNRRIFVFERGSQFEILSKNPDTFMWVSPIPDHKLARYGLTSKKCVDNTRVYRDVLIYKNGYKLTKQDNIFIACLCDSMRRYL